MVVSEKSRQKLAREAMTVAQQVAQRFSTGKPPASELRTPHEAMLAANVLLRGLQSAMTDGLREKNLPLQSDDDVRVGICYVDTSFATLTVTRYVPGQETQKIAELTGQPIIIIGLTFAIVDSERPDVGIAGSKPFLDTKQVRAWLEQLQQQARETNI